MMQTNKKNRAICFFMAMIFVTSSALTVPGSTFHRHTCRRLSTSSTQEEENSMSTRRKALSFMSQSFLGLTAGVVAMGAQPQPAHAKDELFKPNPLTNPVLEQVRIWNQAEADQLNYGGELAPGSPKGRAAYAKLLVPVLEIERDLKTTNDLVRQPNGAGLEKANDILSKSQFVKINFKKVFNAFADNIYYSDPDRANLYLGGGATPKNEQSIAYLLRNDVLTNLEALQAEVIYVMKQQKGGEPLETEDLYLYAQSCVDGMTKYLELVPPGELKMGRELMASN
mmetsp:Transcript_30117/g.43805  ORF Transcript_30117/g.43805 Transcript_30117/m.43805 type:complete len:283 (-) Transcript_30117:64-912(-)